MSEINYIALAHKVFQPQFIRNIEDTDNVIEVCRKLITENGYPLKEDDGVSEGWMEFVYEAQDMWLIANEGYVYKRVKRQDKITENNPDGSSYELTTRTNHPGFNY